MKSFVSWMNVYVVFFTVYFTLDNNYKHIQSDIGQTRWSKRCTPLGVPTLKKYTLLVIPSGLTLCYWQIDKLTNIIMNVRSSLLHEQSSEFIFMSTFNGLYLTINIVMMRGPNKQFNSKISQSSLNIKCRFSELCTYNLLTNFKFIFSQISNLYFKVFDEDPHQLIGYYSYNLVRSLRLVIMIQHIFFTFSVNDHQYIDGSLSVSRIGLRLGVPNE